MVIMMERADKTVVPQPREAMEVSLIWGYREYLSNQAQYKSLELSIISHSISCSISVQSISLLLMLEVATEVAEVTAVTVPREDVVWMEWMQLDILVDLMEDQELLEEMEEMQPMALMVEPEDLSKWLFLKLTWIFFKCLVQSLLMEVLEAVPEEMVAAAMVGQEAVVEAPIHIAQ